MNLESLPTFAVIYVGDLQQMRRFYEECFGWSVIDDGHSYCGLRSHAGLVTLVETADARVEAGSAPRRSATAIKLVVEVESIDDAITAVVAAGGRSDPADRAWKFRGTPHRDVIDPEGNVVQLVQTTA
ncbi:MAG: VOC family protein [Gordonia polyisoprenivorans]|nr:VOC family protein [Gordonia polyisoprenivorans]